MHLASAIKHRALEIGFDFAGIAPASAVKDLEFLPEWLKQGYAGELHYLADRRREDPRHVMPSVNSVVCVGLIYDTAYPYSTEIAETGTGSPRAWISRYGWGKDYHRVMREKLEQLRASVEQAAPGAETRVYVDTGPVVERAFARLSGIGWMGKNTCLINEGEGSWFFLGVVLTNLELQADRPAPDRCGTCTRCLEACPTGALVEPYVMDASRCIAYFNIELKGPIPEEFRAAIGRNVFGCDICQDVCPWNGRPMPMVHFGRADGGVVSRRSDGSTPPRSATKPPIPDFEPLEIETNAQASASTDEQSPAEGLSLFNPELERLAALTEEDFRRAFAHSPIKRVKYRGWLRNVCVAMGNSHDRRFIPWLESAAQNADEMVRAHAVWALRQLQGAH